MPIYVEGTVFGIRRGEWKREGDKEPTRYASLQFAEQSDRPNDDAAKWLEVSLPDGDDGTAYKKGQSVKVAVRVTARERQIFYRAEQVMPAAPRPMAKAQ